MDSFLKSSKFKELKKSFSSAHNQRSNASELSYNLRSASKNISRKRNSIYSKYYNRTYGPSEVIVNDKNLQSSRNLYPQVVLKRINEVDSFSNFNGNTTSAFKERENLAHYSNDVVHDIPTRGNVETSFRLHYSNTSPVKSSQQCDYERRGPQVQPVRILNVSRVERDRDGFAIPTETAFCNPRQRIVETKEEDEEGEDRLLKVMMSEMIDLLSPVKAFYYLKRYEEWLVQEKRKKVHDMFNGYGLDKEKNLQITNWLLSNPHVANREMIEDYVSVSSRSTMHHIHQPNLWHRYKEENTASEVGVFLLKNWTIMKGIGPMDLMASGDLRDIKDQTLIEEGHVTSRILTAHSTIIKTSCCVYHLSGDFCDANNNVPEDIKKYFSNGKFPNQWKEVVRKWNLIKQKESMLRFNYQSDINGYEDNHKMKNSIINKKRKAPTSQEELQQIGVKRRKSHLVLDQSVQQTPVSSRKHSNFSMVTRSVLRMRQGRGDYSLSGRSEAFNKLKERNKTPMPRRKKVQAISDDDSNSY